MPQQEESPKRVQAMEAVLAAREVLQDIAARSGNIACRRAENADYRKAIAAEMKIVGPWARANANALEQLEKYAQAGKIPSDGATMASAQTAADLSERRLDVLQNASKATRGLRFEIRVDRREMRADRQEARQALREAESQAKRLGITSDEIDDLARERGAPTEQQARFNGAARGLWGRTGPSTESPFAQQDQPSVRHGQGLNVSIGAAQKMWLGSGF
jgi:hypothetical protein